MQNASAFLYRHLWPVSLYHVFPHYLINGTILEKKNVFEHKNVSFEFVYKVCLKHFSL